MHYATYSTTGSEGRGHGSILEYSSLTKKERHDEVVVTRTAQQRHEVNCLDEPPPAAHYVELGAHL